MVNECTETGMKKQYGICIILLIKLTLGWRSPLSRARATLYKYDLLAFNIVYMSAIFA